MTGIPELALGPVAGMALRFPKVAASALGLGKFCKAHWKAIAIIVAVLTACVSAYTWIKHDEKAHYEAGFSAAHNQSVAAVNKANAIAAHDQAQLNLMRQRFDLLQPQREQAIRTVIQPQIERITHEVQSNPVYRQCSISDSVRIDINSVIAAVNASIGADAPIQSR